MKILGYASLILILIFCAPTAHAACPTTTGGSPYSMGTNFTCIQVGTSSSGSNPVTLTYNSNVSSASGHFLAAECFFGVTTLSGVGNVSATDTRSDSWVQLSISKHVAGSNNFVDAIIWSPTIASSGANTVTVTLAGATIASFSGCEPYEMVDALGTPVFDAAGTGQGGSVSGTCPCAFTAMPITIAQTNELVMIGCDTAAGTCTFTVPSAPNIGSEGTFATVYSGSGSTNITGSDNVSGDAYNLVSVAIAASSSPPATTTAPPGMPIR
jgi:hypothetical protein